MIKRETLSEADKELLLNWVEVFNSGGVQERYDLCESLWYMVANRVEDPELRERLGLR